MDPVNVCRYFNQRFQAMLNVLCQNNKLLLGEVVDLFWRREYQARGAPNIHMLLWVKNAPKFGEDSDDKVLSFIEEHVICDMPH